MGKNTSSLVIETRFGKVSEQLIDRYQEGTYHAREWLGIRFASPLFGDLRWKTPINPQPWEGICDYSKMPESCTRCGIYARVKRIDPAMKW